MIITRKYAKCQPKRIPKTFSFLIGCILIIIASVATFYVENNHRISRVLHYSTDEISQGVHVFLLLYTRIAWKV